MNVFIHERFLYIRDQLQKILVFTYLKFKIVIKVDPVTFMSGSFFTICVTNFRLEF